MRRFRSVDSDQAINKRNESTSRLQSPSHTSSYIANKPSYGSYSRETATRQNFQQPRFPATNPYARADSTVFKSENEQTKIHTTSNVHTKSTESIPGIPFTKVTKQSKVTRPNTENQKPSSPSANTAIQKMTKEAAEKMNKGRASKKDAKASEQNNSPVLEDKKKGSARGQSKSFVSLMKAKFSRSTTSGRSTSSSEKQTK